MPRSQVMPTDKSREGFFCKTCGSAQHRSLTLLLEILISSAPILLPFNLSWLQQSDSLNRLDRRWSVVWGIQVGFSWKDDTIYPVRSGLISESWKLNNKKEGSLNLNAKLINAEIITEPCYGSHTESPTFCEYYVCNTFPSGSNCHVGHQSPVFKKLSGETSLAISTKKCLSKYVDYMNSSRKCLLQGC